MIEDTIQSQIKPGSVVKVFEKVREGDKERITQFEGIVLARKHGNEPGATFTVRAVISNVGVEKIYPIHSPRITKVEVISAPKKVKRSKLYYLRTLSRKQVRQKLDA
jgi:large subunit ribosomal protein L19